MIETTYETHTKKIEKKSQAELLADQHWKYISEVLAVSGLADTIIFQIGFHYRTAFIHGFKHGAEYTDLIHLNTPY
jgi:hypothetical protein